MKKALSKRAGALSRLPPYAAVLALVFLVAPSVQAEGGSAAYVQRNLVSDGSAGSKRVDPDLAKPWGIAFGSTGPAWIAASGSNLSTVYDGEGNPFPAMPGAVTIPGGAPTGIIASDGTDFLLPGPDGAPVGSSILFATEGGIISGWSPLADPDKAIAMVDNSAARAVYKGIAIAGNGKSRFIYATDFRGGKVDVFDNIFQPVSLARDAFTDPDLPAGFAPFGIRNINGSLYVTYARQDKDRSGNQAGLGEGFINVFNAEGRLIRRFASRGRLNSPWGMAVAPADFGPYSNHLLVANVGDGRINAFDISSGQFLGQMFGPNQRPLAIPGLWGIAFGNGMLGQATNALFFTAGPDGSKHGLYGRIELGSSQVAKAEEDEEEAQVLTATGPQGVTVHAVKPAEQIFRRVRSDDPPPASAPARIDGIAPEWHRTKADELAPGEIRIERVVKVRRPAVEAIPPMSAKAGLRKAPRQEPPMDDEEDDGSLDDE